MKSYIPIPAVQWGHTGTVVNALNSHFLGLGFDLEPYSSTILRLHLTWIISFSQAFTNLDQNGIHLHS